MRHAQCKRVRPKWYVKMPGFIQLGDTSLVSPELHLLGEDESDLNEYMLDPTDPVECLPDQDELVPIEKCARVQLWRTRIHHELLGVVGTLREAHVRG